MQKEIKNREGLFAIVIVIFSFINKSRLIVLEFMG